MNFSLRCEVKNGRSPSLKPCKKLVSAWYICGDLSYVVTSVPIDYLVRIRNKTFCCSETLARELIVQVQLFKFFELFPVKLLIPALALVVDVQDPECYSQFVNNSLHSFISHVTINSTFLDSG